MSLLRMLYLGLAALGMGLPVYGYWQWLQQEWSTDSPLLLPWFVANATDDFAPAMLILIATLALWIVAEVAVRRNLNALLAIPATLFFGPACGLPLYLFLRTRPA